MPRKSLSIFLASILSIGLMAGTIKPILKIDARKIDKDFLGMKISLFWVLNLSMGNLVSPLC
jgi:hypothetical protein